MLLLNAAVTLLALGHHDYNGDGHDDLLVYQHQSTPFGYQLYLGSNAGLVPQAVLLNACTDSAASGDFNNDGFADLALSCGAQIHLHHGHAGGLSVTPTTIFNTSPAALEIQQLVTGDLNNDGYDDLVLSRARENGYYTGEGLMLAWGGPGGLASPVQALGLDLEKHSSLAVGRQTNDLLDDVVVWTQNYLILASSTGSGLQINGFYPLELPELHSPFPMLLGKTSTDSIDDLVIGALTRSFLNTTGGFNDELNAGELVFVRATAGGFPASNVRRFHGTFEGQGNLPFPVNNNDRLGHSVVLGQFDGQGPLDMAAGMPGEDECSNGGAIVILKGKANKLLNDPFVRPPPDGITTNGMIYWPLRNIDNPFPLPCVGNQQGLPQPNQGLGQALAVGDFNGDGFDDLAMGAPYHPLVQAVTRNNTYWYTDAGALVVLFGSSEGLVPGQGQVVLPGDPGVYKVSPQAGYAGYFMGSRLH